MSRIIFEEDEALIDVEFKDALRGAKGDKGDKGEKGDTGTKGDKGDKGDQGEKGDQGIQGIQGIKGDQGIQGVQGIRGEQGIKGDKGDRGEKGEKGDAGETYDDTGIRSDLAKADRSLEFLWKLNRGISYDIETDRSAAYSKAIPSGAKLIDIKSIGGKSEVIEGEIIHADVDSVLIKKDDSTLLKDIEIRSEIRSLTGYGWSAGNVYNEVDLVNKKFIQRVSMLGLGDLEWSYSEVNASFHVNIPNSKDKFENAVIPLYTYGGVRSLLQDKQFGYWNLNDLKRIAVKDSSYTDAQTFKTAMRGVKICYELADYVETDISLYIDESFKCIELEGGGSITFHQSGETMLPVTNTEEYVISLAR